MEPKEKIVRFIDCVVPITVCNLRCHYCYITAQRLYDKKHYEFKYPPETVKAALTKERLGGPCYINFCGAGETLIPREIIDYVRVVLENGHYVMIITNGILTERINAFRNFPPELKSRLGFKFSFHYLELIKHNLLDQFFSNVKSVQDDPYLSFSLEITPSDELEPYIDEIKKTSMDKFGALPHLTVPRDVLTSEIKLRSSHSKMEFIDKWASFDSEMFRFKLSTFNVHRKEFCYAGEWSFHLNLGTGDVAPCYGFRVRENIFEDVTKPIDFSPVCRCILPHCYNSHAFLTVGTIPQMDTPDYNSIRDRVTADGSHWMKEPLSSFFRTKLAESHEQYSESMQRKLRFRAFFYYLPAFLIRNLRYFIKVFLLIKVFNITTDQSK